MNTQSGAAAPLTPEQLRWICDPDQFEFETTAELPLSTEFHGQDTAREALSFGLSCHAPGQNIYVRGSRGTGRLRMVESLLREMSPSTDGKRDFCYVHHFSRPDHPRLVTLAPGEGHRFRKAVESVGNYVEHDLAKQLDGEPHATQRAAIRDLAQAEIKALMDPLEKDLAEAGLAMVSMPQAPVPQTAIFPIVEGQPVPPDQLKAMIARGEADGAALAKYEEVLPEFQKRLPEAGKQAAAIYRDASQRILELNEQAVRKLMKAVTRPVAKKYPFPAVEAFLDEIVETTVEWFRDPNESTEEFDFRLAFGVNVVLTQSDPTACPVIRESLPSMMNLLGTVEPKFGPGGQAISDYQGIRAGALLNADQGYLILDVDDLLAEPGAWRALMRTLRTGRLEIVPPEVGWMRPYVVTQPEPIPIKVRVVLIGDLETYYLLDYNDPDFRDLFKVLADFDSELPRNDAGRKQYAAVLAYLSSEEGLPPFHRSAVAALVEHGARIVSRGDKLTARFGRIADIAREAAFLSIEPPVTGDEVREAIRRTKARASLPSRRFQEFVERGTILVCTRGEQIGQINGLAVMQAGPLTYGFPARITATIGPGQAGLINIEGRAQMSGAIHTKGFHILGGLLRYLLDTQHPLAFSASLAFEQSYGGIDGDSASGAEIVCLLSALTGLPIRQSMAMTGAIDQHGQLEAIGGVNEKIEGFFDTCSDFGLTGDQGVVIPLANAGDLMLRHDVVEAAREGRFHVYATDRIEQAMEWMMGVPAGTRGADGQYPPESILGRAVEKAESYWRLTMASPQRLTHVARGELSDEQRLILPTDPREM